MKEMVTNSHSITKLLLLFPTWHTYRQEVLSCVKWFNSFNFLYEFYLETK